MINGSRKVAIFAGAGVRDARAEVLALAETVGAPIGHSLRGKEWIQYDNPYDVGMTGLLGYGAAHDGIHGADLLLLIGTDFPYDQSCPTTFVPLRSTSRPSGWGVEPAWTWLCTATSRAP